MADLELEDEDNFSPTCDEMLVSRLLLVAMKSQDPGAFCSLDETGRASFDGTMNIAKAIREASLLDPEVFLRLAQRARCI